MSLLDNKKAGFNFELGDKYEAGMELLGGEVKTVKGGHGSLEGAYVAIRGGEAFLLGAFIPPYQPGNTAGTYDPYRVRRLLLTKKELAYLIGKDKQKGLTLIPLSVYNKEKLVKLRFAIGKPKKKFDKRESIKQRDTEREVRRELKDR